MLLYALCDSQRCVHCHATAAVYRACSCLQELQHLSFALGYLASIAVSVRTSFQIVTNVYSSSFYKLICLLTINLLSAFCINCFCLPLHVFCSLQFCSLLVRLCVRTSRDRSAVGFIVVSSSSQHQNHFAVASPPCQGNLVQHLANSLFC